MRCSSWPAGNRTCPCSTSKELAEEALLVRLGEAHRAFFAHQPRNGVVVGLSGRRFHVEDHGRSEEHTSELQSLMRISYAVFCLKKKKHQTVYYESQDKQP